jgi:uroporphyrin-III C-methyltransferase/precorrin-2 dehydrogenase/sirohydrochlorin ferrochelatase
MSFLPIAINITNKRIGIIGGGKVAAQKLKNLLPFTSNIWVIAPEIQPEISDNRAIRCIPENYSSKHLEGLFLVYACTNSPELNAQVQADAEALGILCNRTDCAEESRFHSPAIVQTGNFVVAVNSRQKEVRKTVRIQRDLQHFVEEREQLLREKEQQVGKVFLVGFGPGNPDLLSRRGEQLLFQADIIFYDDLLDAGFLSRYGAEKIYVGKRRANHSKEQDEINILVLRNAFEKTRKQMKVNTLSINALSDFIRFPMFAKLTLKKT